jgi:hypothetical protein
MFAPATASEARRAPSCPTCFAPMVLLRAVAPAVSDGLRVFQCAPCSVAMFTEIG